VPLFPLLSGTAGVGRKGLTGWESGKGPRGAGEARLAQELVPRRVLRVLPSARLSPAGGPHHAPPRQRAAIARAIGSLKLAAGSVLRSRIRPSAMRLVPSYYWDGAIADGDAAVGSIWSAFAIVCDCVESGRLPDPAQVEELRQIGYSAAQLGIPRGDLQAFRAVSAQIGWDELVRRLERTEAGRAVLPRLAVWFGEVMRAVASQMDTGHSGHPSPVQPRPAIPSLVAWLLAHRDEAAWSIANAVLASGIYPDQTDPALARELRDALARSLTIFASLLSENREMTDSERGRLVSFAGEGFHAEIPTTTIERAIRCAADAALEAALVILPHDQPSVAHEGVMGSLAMAAHRFRNELVSALWQSRRACTRLSPDVSFDADSARLICATSSRSARLLPREAATLSRLLDANGRPVSSAELAEALGGAVRPVDLSTVHLTVSRLRRQLEPFGLAPRLVTLRRIGYTWSPVLSIDPQFAQTVARIDRYR
jgi:hypothetical protein